MRIDLSLQELYEGVAMYRHNNGPFPMYWRNLSGKLHHFKRIQDEECEADLNMTVTEEDKESSCNLTPEGTTSFGGYVWKPLRILVIHENLECTICFLGYLFTVWWGNNINKFSFKNKQNIFMLNMYKSHLSYSSVNIFDFVQDFYSH